MSTIERIVAAVRALAPEDRQDVLALLDVPGGETSHELWLEEWGRESVSRYEKFLASGEEARPPERVFAIARAQAGLEGSLEQEEQVDVSYAVAPLSIEQFLTAVNTLEPADRQLLLEQIELIVDIVAEEESENRRDARGRDD